MGTIKKTNKIWVPYGNVRRLARNSKLSEVTISNILNGKSNSPQYNEIRWIAIKEYGGVEIKTFEQKKSEQ